MNSKKTNTVSIPIETVINDLSDLTKAQKEELYLKAGNFSKEQGQVKWENDKIVGFALNKPINSIQMTIVIDKDKVDLQPMEET